MISSVHINKRTLVLGASLNPERYSNKAICQLRRNGHEVLAVGLKAGQVGDVEILTEWPSVLLVHTITIYLSARNQTSYYNRILSSGAERLIFNPGAENEDLFVKAQTNGVFCTNACTLVQLSLRNY